jgi:hypothetical protein
MNLNKKIYKQKTTIRHYLKKHQKLQKLASSLYLKYCYMAGPFHTLPNFLIVGFPKCGTTSLYEYLIQHPSIHSASGKEIDYFDRLYERGLSWYRMSFPTNFTKINNETFLKKTFQTGEATPRYMVHPHSLDRIKTDLPNAKFIVLLRNPIERAYSHFNMNFKNDYEYRTFEDALNHEKKRVEGRYEKMKKNENYYSWDYDLYAYLEHGKYVDKLKRWMNVFPKDQFLIIQSEEFSKDPSKIYNETLEFLGLPKYNLKHYKRYKQREYKDKNIDPKLREKLSEYFKPYNDELYEFLGKKFDWD